MADLSLQDIARQFGGCPTGGMFGLEPLGKFIDGRNIVTISVDVPPLTFITACPHTKHPRIQTPPSRAWILVKSAGSPYTEWFIPPLGVQHPMIDPRLFESDGFGFCFHQFVTLPDRSSCCWARMRNTFQAVQSAVASQAGHALPRMT